MSMSDTLWLPDCQHVSHESEVEVVVTCGVVDCFARILADARRAIVAVRVEDAETEDTNKMVLLAGWG
jgi:hypothetical protein